MQCILQSDGKSFCGDVVLDGFNKAFRDEDTILDQTYKIKFVRFYYIDFNAL